MEFHWFARQNVLYCKPRVISMLSMEKKWKIEPAANFFEKFWNCHFFLNFNESSFGLWPVNLIDACCHLLWTWRETKHWSNFRLVKFKIGRILDCQIKIGRILDLSNLNWSNFGLVKFKIGRILDCQIKIFSNFGLIILKIGQILNSSFLKLVKFWTHHL